MREPTSGEIRGKNVVGKNVAMALGLLIVILVVGLVGAGVHYTSVITEKDITIAGKEFDISTLISLITNQTAQYAALQSEHSTLRGSYSLLESDYASLHFNYTALQANQSALQSSYASLQSDYASLQLAYDSLLSVAAYSTLRNQINLRTLQYSYSNLSDFITPTDAAVLAEVLYLTGGWGDPSDWQEYRSDIQQLYEWVANNVAYRSDGLFPVLPSIPSGNITYRNDMWQCANETLELLQGDCEDMAILLTSMIQCYTGGAYGAECILITGAEKAHMGVQILVAGSEVMILDPSGKYYTQASGHVTSGDIATEIANWLTYWQPTLGSNVYVSRVFSDALDQSFFSTGEYLAWMYRR